MTTEGSQVKDEENRNKSTAYIWKSTSLEPVIHNVSLRRGISKVALGSEHTLLLNFNCEIFSLGDNSYGQLGLGDNTKRTQASVVDFFLDRDDLKVIDVACGGYFSAVICDNGEVFCWGDSSSGQCGIGTTKQTNIPVRVLFNEENDVDEDSNNCNSDTSSTSSNCFDDHNSKSTSDSDSCEVKQLSCGDVHTLALTEDGQVWSWGSGCQVGHGIATEKVTRPQKIGALRGKKVTSVVCGAYHSMVLVQDDSLNCNAIRGRSTPRKISAQSTKEVAKKLNRQRSSSSKEPSKSRSPSQPSKIRALSVSAPPGSNFLENYASERRDSESARTYLSYNSAIGDLKKSVENEALVTDNTSTSRNTTCTPLGHFEAAELRKNMKEKDIDTTNCVLNVMDGESKDSQPLEVCESHFGASPQDEECDSLNERRYLEGNKSVSRVEENESSNTHTNCSLPSKHNLESISISSKEKPSTDHESVEQLSGMADRYECVTPPTPSSSSSAGSTSYFGSTDSDSEDVPPKRKVSSPGFKPSLKSRSSWTSPKQENLQDHVSLGLAALGSKLKPDVNLTKLTSAVLESVTGMFMSAMPSDMPVTGVKAIESGAYCHKCGMYGICLCPEEEVPSASDFVLAGSNMQVWSWGMGGCGQLGQGDTDDRSIPCNIKSLTGVGVVKIAAGTFHSLALTTYSQVYSWGDNSCGQLGRKKSILLVPKKLKCLSDVLVWDISAGSHYSLFIGDGALSQPDVYVCGRQPSGLPMLATSATRVKEGITEHVDVKAEKRTMKKLNRLISSSSFDDVKERSLRNSRVEVVRLTMFRKVGQLRGVFANTENCCCLAASTQGGQLPILYELASSERVFYYQLALIWQVIIVPVLHSEAWTMIHSQDDGQVFTAVVKNFYHVMECVSSNLVAVTETAQNLGSCQQLFDFCLSESFFNVFERYSDTFSDAVAFGAFRTITKTSNDIIFQCRAILNKLLEDFDNSGISNWQSLQTVLEIPLERIQNYKRVFSKLLLTAQTRMDLHGVVNTRLTERMEMWSDLISDCENKLTVADLTREIWEEGPSKVVEVMKVPKRRIVRNSKVYTLFPSKTHRFASHWFLLFNDYFVHIQSTKNFQAYSLKTLWAEGVDDSEGLLNGIKITTPEENLLLCAPTSTDKADWLVAINQTVANVISRTTSYRLSTGAVNMLTGNLTAASAREAPHTFTVDNRYRGAAYKGMWLTGKPHGHGELLWPDGRHYTGEFRNGYRHGEGAMVWPEGTCPAPDLLWVRYEGQWEEGKIAGYGKMRYSNGDRYSGSWRESMRHGHGSMRSGSVSSAAATVYLGEWTNDKKCGYGVQDEILKGEKYMGMWENDCRQGSGVIVTVEGIYNEGIFVQNKLVGIGLLLSDDNTRYEGEFTGNCHLAGKGVLTMPNGDYIEGSFTGLWGEGIKIAGTFYKSDCLSDTSGVPASTPRKAKTGVPPCRKWTALFQQCRVALGCRHDNDCDTQTAWKYVSIALLSGHDGKLPRSQQDVMQELLNTNNEVERTGKPASCDVETLQAYLTRAFELRYHPFGQLVEGLVDVFRASYVGMGTHRRLLSHAVAEVKSFVQRLYNLVRLLFPDLPNEDYVHLATDTVTGVANHCTEEGIISTALLHPLLFPRLYPTLFTLYALGNEKHDSMYWERISQLNKRSDVALMTYVGMKRKFWLSRDNELDNCGSDELKESYRAPKHYISAVENLQQISTKFSPMEKLSLLRTTFEKINEEVELFWQGEEKLVSLDDIFPVFQFVVLRSRIPHLGSEIQFIDDMVDSHVHVGEQGHMFTTLKACYFQIQNEKAM